MLCINIVWNICSNKDLIAKLEQFGDLYQQV